MKNEKKSCEDYKSKCGKPSLLAAHFEALDEATEHFLFESEKNYMFTNIYILHSVQPFLHYSILNMTEYRIMFCV